MKKHYLLIILAISWMALNPAARAQAPIDFEANGTGASYSWNVFENGNNPALEIIANPHATGINTSATVAKFTARADGQPYAGTESVHGNFGPLTFSASNSTVKIMVYKTVISDVGIKFAEANGEAQPEVKVANTKINEWEELTFDLSGSIGKGITKVIDQIIVFPDFAARAQENIIYFDNITFSGTGGTGGTDGPVSAAPAPSATAADVLSIFSDTYTNVAGTDFDPDWGQATDATQVAIAGNNTLKYDNLNYQGTVLGSAQDVTEYASLHIDYWTSNATALAVSLISTGPLENKADITITKSAWMSIDIPLTAFTVPALNDIIQLKFEGNGTVYLDNIYFSNATGGGGSGGGSSISAIDFEANGTGASYSWNVFENGNNPALEIIANPHATGINTSATVAKFTARADGQPYAGTESVHGNFGPLTFSASNSTVKIMVYKTVISDIGIKFAESNGEAQPEVKVANTKINEWEELTFDLSGSIGKGITKVIDQIIVFPDFAARAQENIIYFDNITFSGAGGTGGSDELKLVWADEFTDAGAVKADNWHHQTQLPNNGSWYNGEEQHYTNRLDNSFAADGYLQIVAKKENFTDQSVEKQYTSARLNSKFAFTYGRVDVRAKLASGNGTWPAIWMLGTNINEPGGYWASQNGTVNWPASGEIDIMEHWGNNPNVIHGSLHTPSSSGSTVNTGTITIADVSTTYHVYSMDWDKDKISFLVDDVVFYTYNPSEKNADTWPFDKPQYLLLNVAMGGIGGAIDPSFTESAMSIDYVRVYQKESDQPTVTEPVVAAPAPAADASGVLSIFSDTYTNVADTDFDPDWGQATDATQVAIAGNNTLKYDNLNYQGTVLGSAQDVSGFASLHIDYWTSNATALAVSLISTGPLENKADITVTKNAWMSIDIPLTAFTVPALNDIIQLKFDGNGTVYLDNIYFHGVAGDGGGETGAMVSLPFDFETAPVTADFVDFSGGIATVISNPKSTGINTSTKVGQMVRDGGEIWAGSKLILKDKIDFATKNAFRMKVYSPRVDVPILFKLEGPNAAKEISMSTTKANEWETIEWDFTDTPSNTYNEIVFIFDFGTVGDGSANSTFLFDDVELFDNTGGLSKIDLPVTFESASVNYTMTDFGGNATTMSADPKNSANTVAMTTKTTGAATWAGTTIGTNFGLASRIPFTSTEAKINVLVYSPAAGTPIRMKAEDHKDVTLTVETEAVTTKANAWERLTFDFTNVASGTNPFNPATHFDMLSIFFNFGTEGTDQVYYWDDVFIGQGEPLEETLSLWDQQDIRVYAHNGQLTIKGSEALMQSEVNIYNLSGKMVYSTILQNEENQLSLYAKGILIVRITNRFDGSITIRKISVD